MPRERLRPARAYSASGSMHSLANSHDAVLDPLSASALFMTFHKPGTMATRRPRQGAGVWVNQLKRALGDLDVLADLHLEVATDQRELHEEMLMLEDLEKELSQRLVDVSMRRRKVLRSLNKMKTTLHSLPPELLIQVFVHATSTDKSSHRWYLHSETEWGPVEISHVCQKWRSLALGTSCLWSTMFARNAIALAAYIDRAGHQDIDLVWKDVKCDSVSGFDRLSKLTRDGIRDRVRSVAWVDELLSVHTLLAYGRFTKLRRLILHRAKNHQQEEASKSITIHDLAALLGRLPLLEDLTLNGYSSIVDEVPGKVIIALPHLRAFTWNRTSAKKLWRLFSAMDFSGLQTLRLSTRTTLQAPQNELSDEYSTVIHLPDLRQLCLICDNTDAFKLACRKLDLPSLQSLVLARSLPGTFPILPSPEKIFREPRLAHITRLSLHNLELHLEDTITLLSYSPSLKTLVLDSCNGNHSYHCIVILV